jgi:tetratricopeptide (TPR) repeat protein
MAANPNSPMDETPQIPNGAASPAGNEIQRPEPPRKKRKKKLWIILGVVILAVLVFNPFSLIFLSVFVGMGHIKIVEAKLQKPAVYEPVAERLATYCQSDQSLFPKILSYAWLPVEISRLGHPWCEIATNFASVEMGGGFYHFGYTLELDETASTPAKNVWHLVGNDEAGSVPATNVWNLFLAREGSSNKLLMTLRLAATQHVTGEDLEKLVGASFDQSIKEGDGGYQSKVMLQLRFGQTTQAVATCMDWMKAKPDSWRARFTYAHVRCRMGETEPAAAQFSDWVDTHKAFGNYIYLALFNYREGRTNQAVNAVRMALSQPLVELPDEGASIFYLAQNGAMIAYTAGDFDLCLSICDKMLADSDRQNWWKRNALRIKAAATFMKGNQTAAIDLMKQAENANDPDPFSHEPRAKADQVLLGAIQRKDAESVRNIGNWSDELEKWYSPFETDESEFHGSDLHIPTPYPASWKTDYINPSTPQ